MSDMTGTDPDARRADLASRLTTVRERITAASRDAGRVDEPTLVVVTKNFPRSDLDHLLALGVRDVGENREQEASAKLAEGGLPDDLRAHFIGQLQSKKANAVARWADVVQSVDRPKLVGALARAAENAGRELTVLVQVNLDGVADGGAEGGTGAAPRGGVAPSGVLELAAEISATPLRLGGVMAVAPREGDPDAAFAVLADLSAQLRQSHPEATWVSAGMSADLEAAVRHGATHLRVGTAILGSRQSHR